MTTKSLVVGTIEIYTGMLDVSRSTFHRIMRDDPTFPKPFKIGLRKNAWFREDVEAWIMARAAGVAA